MDAYFKLTVYKPNNLLRSKDFFISHLKLAKFILNATLEAIDYFYIKKYYHLFDAHVGDAMCQIRALKLIDLATKNTQPPKNIL